MSKSEEERIQAYLDLIAGHYTGNVKQGEVEIVRDPQKILDFQNALEQKFGKSKGVVGNINALQAGLVFSDKFFTLIRDMALLPPSSNQGEPIPVLYSRMLYTNSLAADDSGNAPGVCILPMLKEKIVLNVIFRHGVRAWCAETLGTIAMPGEDIQNCIKRCVKKELPIAEGRFTSEYLGEIISERGLIGARVKNYIVNLLDDNFSHNDGLESTIANHLVMSPEEIIEAIGKGSLQINSKEVLFQDGYLSHALLQYINKMK